MGCRSEQPSARGADFAHSSVLQLGAVPCHARKGLNKEGKWVLSPAAFHGHAE